ncbi:MAG: hypothetical protein ACRBDL_00505 [Alphaproteobacteria bacterium]
MAEQKAADVTKQEVEQAQKMWDNFVVGSKFTIYATCILLIALALGFVKFV